MQMHRWLMFIAICLAGPPVGPAAQGNFLACQKPTRQYVQTIFGLEEPLHRPVALPSAALHALRRDDYAKACIKQHPDVNELGAWFTASEIDLNNDGRLDLVVQASERAPLCLKGANIGPFWVLQNLGDKYRIVLRAHLLGIEVIRRKTRGFSDIKGTAATAVDVLTTAYQFDGTTYRPRKRMRKSIGA
jgi:hypothetical protein